MLLTGSGPASVAVHGNRALAKKLQDGVRRYHCGKAMVAFL